MPAASGSASVANYPGDDTADRDVLPDQPDRQRQARPGLPHRCGVQPQGPRRVRLLRRQEAAGHRLARAELRQAAGQAHAAQPRGRGARRPSFRKVYGLGRRGSQGWYLRGREHRFGARGLDHRERQGPALSSASSSAEGKPPAITRQPAVRLAAKDVQLPQVASRGQKVVVAYSDAGKIKARVSGDDGETFDEPALVVSTGSRKAALTRALR